MREIFNIYKKSKKINNNALSISISKSHENINSKIDELIYFLNDQNATSKYFDLDSKLLPVFKIIKIRKNSKKHLKFLEDIIEYNRSDIYESIMIFLNKKDEIKQYTAYNYFMGILKNVNEKNKGGKNK